MSEDQLRDILAQFFDPAISGKQDLVYGILSKDSAAIISATHSLKGAASFIGLSTISSTCETIEENVKNNQLHFQNVLINFETEWSETQAEIEELLKHH
jgi:HPt (histidine-containing phosphotransfer) domain-containing protein